MQAYLREKRGLLKRLSDRLQELNHLDHGAESSEDVGEDLLGEDEDDGESRSEGLLANGAFAKTTGQTPATDQVSWAQASTATETRGAMRARHAPADLSTNRAKTSSTQLDPALATTEKLFSHNRGEQEDLTASLLNMAQALKASSRAFSSSLDSEKEILNRAGEGLEKNTTGLQAAEKRMGMLRRMTEGRGWWGRMLMYAWIFGLMMIALFIVGFLPKLRF
ncbi:MAG: hypothetical protein M1838_000944 [Thelocarpon superellum]|nr:MAG: hypothetical protein M1838_000944 [Thelocarpon superellum]